MIYKDMLKTIPKKEANKKIKKIADDLNISEDILDTFCKLYDIENKTVSVVHSTYVSSGCGGGSRSGC